MKRASRAAGVSRFLLLGLGVVIALLGLALAVGGAKLVSLGGSWYFLLGGVVMAISGLLIARCKPAGAWLFAAFLLATAVWAVADVGLEYWPLFSRLFMFAVIGVVGAGCLWRRRRIGAGRGGGGGQYVCRAPKRCAHRCRPGHDPGGGGRCAERLGPLR